MAPQKIFNNLYYRLAPFDLLYKLVFVFDLVLFSTNQLLILEEQLEGNRTLLDLHVKYKLALRINHLVFRIFFP